MQSLSLDCREFLRKTRIDNPQHKFDANYSAESFLRFAMVSGIWLMFFSGNNLSVAGAVGFISLSAVAADTFVVMLVYLDEAFNRFKADDRMKSWIF